LRPDKAAGSNELSPRILSQLKEVICYLVTMIMWASIESGVVPDEWRSAYVTPIYKPDLQVLRNDTWRSYS